MERGNVRNLVLAFPDGARLEAVVDAADPPGGSAAVCGAVDPAAEMPATAGPGGMPRDDVLEYISEMCDALAYMARAQHCDGLARLLHDAAAEAKRRGPSI